MKVLLVCPFFPPETAIASLRIAKFAHYWAEAGCDVVVIARKPVSGGMSMEPHSRVTVLRTGDPLGSAISSTGAARSTVREGAPFRTLRWLKRRILAPDQFVLWALKARRSNLPKGWVPDIVVGSGGPLSALVLASSFSRRFKRPLALDFRDPIATSAHYLPGRVRQVLDFQLERAVVKRADLVVSVSSGCAAEIGSAHDRPVGVIYNGYEPGDYAVVRTTSSSPNELRLVYTGTVYADHTDLRPLFRSIAAIRISSPALVVRFDHYGPANAFETLSKWAAVEGVQDCIHGHGLVSHEEARTAQRRADALVLLLWRDVPEFRGYLSGKLFEYLGAQRPIIQVGAERGEAAEIVRRGELNVVSSDAEVLLEHLKLLVRLKTATGRVPETFTEGQEVFSRQEQSLQFLSLLNALRSA